ncbi:MAG TPA: TonB-dependent receptor [Bryobacteraceae bacterium]|nr:TonB-dependent receptor [Bryobacteraceae bacterium]
MSIAKTHSAVASLVMGMACLAAPAFAGDSSPVRLAGTIAGVVANASGVPQMGATVILFNKQDRPVQKAQTDAKGEFRFAGLFPDAYSIRVSLATFLPAFRRDILVQPGMRSILSVSLNTLFSTIQIGYPVAIENGGVMSDEWKWVLRSAASTRPVLRLVGDSPLANVPESHEHAAMFSDTRGVLRVSAGDSPVAGNVSEAPGMGTAFAVATSLYGNNLLRVSGDLGYGAATGVPTAAFRTSYSRQFFGDTPEISLTVRQLRLGGLPPGSDPALTELRTMSAGLDDRKELDNNVTLQYGFAMDAVSFVDHLNYFSPYSRLTWAAPHGGKLEFAYSSGNARPDLGAAEADENGLQHDLSALGQFPRISLRNGRPEVQRGEEYEAAYSQKAGSRTYRVSAYHEIIRNATLSMLAPEGAFAGGNILPDVFTGNSIFNLGDLRNSGFDLSVTQQLGEHVNATIIYGSEGALTVGNRELVSNSPDELRAMIRAGRKQAATARLAATAPRSGTHLIASYQWANDQRWILSGNLYSTQGSQDLPGLNVYVRQPLPHPTGSSWRMEATADLRNMLAQGYIPLNMAGGQRVLLFDTPRCFRGGLSFIF